MLIILSGPPGAGKSTVAEILAKKFPRSVQFSNDTIRHFIKNGYVAPWESSEESKIQLKLADDISKVVVEKYIDSGYTVVLDGVFFDEDVNEYQKLFHDIHSFILLPPIEILKERDDTREKDRRVPHRVEPSHINFSSKEHKLLQVLDNSNQTPEETADLIFSKLKSLT